MPFQHISWARTWTYSASPLEITAALPKGHELVLGESPGKDISHRGVTPNFKQARTSSCVCVYSEREGFEATVEALAKEANFHF